MGDNNTILLDEANIWEFPSRLNDYPTLAIGEFGATYDSVGNIDGGRFTELGIHWQFNEEKPWILGTYFHNSEVREPDSSFFRTESVGYNSLYGYYKLLFPYNDTDTTLDDTTTIIEGERDPSDFLLSNQRIDLFYGRLLGGQTPFGFRLSFVHSSQRNDINTNVDQEGFNIYDLAFGLTLQSNTDVTAGLTLMSWKDKETLNGSEWDESKPKSNYRVYGALRHFWQPGSPAWTVIPHGQIYIGKNGAEYRKLVVDGDSHKDSLWQTAEYSLFGFEVGSGLQYTPSNDATVILDFGLKFDKVSGDFENYRDTEKTKNKATLKTLALPFFRAGADLKVFDWMDLRLGATSYWNRRTRENDSQTSPDKFIQNWANNTTYLGFGFHWGNLHVDTYTDPGLFLNGFNFISGQTSNMNFQLSAVYDIM
jgi:hypothetical protein